MKRAAIVVSSIVVSLLGVAAAPTLSEAITRRCRSVTVTFQPEGEGSAVFLRATNVSCDRARRVAKACLRGSHVGWSVSHRDGRRAGIDVTRIVLSRQRARVSFEVAGGGGCG